ncbi:Tim44-like domain-containing protein [Actimicrobium sp. CCC2.4]|uniref:Tim44 domain-containing protein n=1 Tax=Actimicrobium sp. CCC2.4 TaxID=3048606 RepID=UPI002AC9AE2C|nr:Tim44-like domain-containing protein [Actimicrobium sp. CCC2.4]MEB0134397.1 Tim44-like domain-containing protein [Actimicrobium sp. CCC2.4]WPX33034.1 Tim44-like domain-containing protein [Actimicrobium sp. CCC2.4]
MKKYLLIMMLAFGALSMVATEVAAKRMGGGGSFGRQSQGVSRQAPSQSSQAASQARPATPAAAPGVTPPKPASPWRGMLGGALLGLGLGAMLSHFGLGGAMASMISTLLMVGLLAAAAFFIYRMFKRKTDDGSKPGYAGGYDAGSTDNSSRNYTPEIGSRIEPVAQPAALQSVPLASGAAAAVAEPFGVPADFDVPGFLRNSKTYFIRLQAAWDKADINDIREFTSSEMFAELRLQIQERGASANVTDVVKLDAELMGVETVGGDYLASVKFSGMIKESENAPAEPFAEAWNLSKPTSGQGGWILAGIQQLS